MAEETVVKIPLAEIVTTFFVRKELNEERVSQLIKLAQAHVEIPPIKVWRNENRGRYETITGRHRLEMATRLEWKAIPAIVVDEPDFANRVIIGVEENVNGPLTPTDEDYQVALNVLLRANVPRRHIMEIFPLPKGYVIKLLHDLQSRETKLALNRAVAAVLAGMSIPKAAEKFKVDISSVKSRMAPRKQTERIKTNYTEFTGGFSQRFKKFSLMNAADYRKMIDAYDNGHLSAEEVRKLFYNVNKSFQTAVAALENWRTRFEVKVYETEEHEEGQAEVA